MTIQHTEAHDALAQVQQHDPLQTINPTAGTIDLIKEAQELQAAYQFGEALASTQFVPDAFRGKPGDVAAAVLAGRSVGMDPITSLQNVFVVKGKPAMYARTMHAIVLAAGHEVVRTAASTTSVTVAARRKGEAEWQEFTWTIDRAKDAGYVGTNKKYQSDPIAMLTAKAIAEACRTIAPDVLTGVAAYAAEEIELEDMGERTPPPLKAAPSAGLQAQAAAAASAPEPAADAETGEVIDWWAEFEATDQEDAAALRTLYSKAQLGGADKDLLDSIAAAGKAAA